MSMGKKLGALVCALFTIGLIGAGTAAGATFTVDTTADGPATPADCTTPAGACSIRDALSAVSSSTDPADEVVIPAGTYVLTEGELSVSGDDTTLAGAGARQTIIDGNAAGRVFNVQADVATIRDLRAQNGFAAFDPGEVQSFPGDGGAIIATGEELALERVTLADNEAELNGGGIAAPPEGLPATELTITESTISGNRVTGPDPVPALESIGGGIQAFGDLTMTNSTVAGNAVETPGPGPVFGGGLAIGVDQDLVNPADFPTAIVTNSTIAGNGIAAPTGLGSGVGVFNPAPLPLPAELEFRNTIVAGNTGTAPLTTNCGSVGMPTSANNLSSDASCMFTDPGSLEDTDPQLAGLADNGGPTDTLALPEGSPAVNAGTNEGCPATDQRGITRPQENVCDIGAFEREFVAPPPPPPPPPEPGAERADLALKMKVKPKAPKVGKKVRYAVTVRNLGPDAAPGTKVKGKLPIVTKKIAGRNDCTVRGNRPGKRKFQCPIGNLANGESIKLKLVAEPDSRIRRPRATARVSSDVTDPDRSNNRAKAVVRVKGA